MSEGLVKVIFKLPLSTCDRVDREAAERGKTRSEYIREALHRAWGDAPFEQTSLMLRVRGQPTKHEKGNTR
jgi:predicted DNA-binding protein